MEAQIALLYSVMIILLSSGTSQQSFLFMEQITLHELIIQHNIPLHHSKVAHFVPSNCGYIALRMIREFNQKESEDNVRETLWHPDSSVRYLAVQVAGDLDMRSTLETLKHMYKIRNTKFALKLSNRW